MNKLSVLETWFQDLWIEEKLDTIDKMLQPSTRVEGLRETPQVGPEEFKPFVTALLAHVRVRKVEIKHSLEDGDWITALIAMTHEARSSCKTIYHTGQVLARIEDGKIVEGYNHIDFLTLFEALGLLPEATLSICLQGKSLTADTPSA